MANFSIVTNIGAVRAHNQLSKTQGGLQKTINRLSTGLRINQAGDDAAGLAIADTLRADVAALNQGVRNANDGISMINVTDAALGEVSNLLQRAITLAEQAASETSGADASTSKTAINDEYNQILDEIDRIANTVEFNGVKLLDGSSGTVDIQVGTGSTANDQVGVGQVDSRLATLTTESGIAKDTLDTSAEAKTELVNLQSAIDHVASLRGDLGATFNRLEFTINVTMVQAENLRAAESQIRDANVAEEVVNMTKFQVLNQTGLSSLAQANASSQSVLALLG